MTHRMLFLATTVLGVRTVEAQGRQLAQSKTQ